MFGITGTTMLYPLTTSVFPFMYGTLSIPPKKKGFSFILDYLNLISTSL